MVLKSKQHLLAGDAGRSEALSLLVIDEAAFIDNVEEIWTSSQSTLSTGGGAIVLSTPNGVGNWFHKIWLQGQSGEQWNPIELHWSVHPERDQKWREEQSKLLGEKGAAQECDCDFISSGHTVVEGSTLKWYEETYVKDPMEKVGLMVTTGCGTIQTILVIMWWLPMLLVGIHRTILRFMFLMSRVWNRLLNIKVKLIQNNMVHS